MPGIDNQELVEQLNAFMRLVPKLWTWQELAKMYASKDKYIEYRGPEENMVTFDLYILEDDVQSGKRYLNVGISVSDLRAGMGKGSTYQPLCNNFIWYEDGEIDMGFSKNEKDN